MARKARQRISYVLPLADDAVGHRLGVNGIAIDERRSMLYSGGRDGVVCAWKLESRHDGTGSPKSRIMRTVYQGQVQTHTHWINDLVLVDDCQAIVTASSDVSVKLWRPSVEGSSKPQPVGLHSDYVKCLSYPGSKSTWVASGGLDSKVCLWDLNGAGHLLQINNAEEDNVEKGSVYALASRDHVVAGGGPESVVKLWDIRSGRRVCKLVGHTDHIRSILLSETGDTILTASSDQTVKVWSVAAGRCMHTLTMHNDSVWSLYAKDASLSVFYSGDRSGLVAKTDTRGATEVDEGLSVAICQEQQGIHKIFAAWNNVWTATASSNINRWEDLDTDHGVQITDGAKVHRWNATSRSRNSSIPPLATTINGEQSRSSRIPLSSVLRLSNLANFPPQSSRDSDRNSTVQSSTARFAPVFQMEPTVFNFAPLRNLPLECVEGQIGLTKHVMLNDKRRVLVVDTAGDVVMWDVIKCIPTRSFGKRNLEDVVKEENTDDSTSHWCAVDTRTGSLTCVLEENHCFDAEVYADELEEARDSEFREDQRINLGKWVLRYLFAGLLEEEIRRDEIYRRQIVDQTSDSLAASTRVKSAAISNSPQPVPLKTPGLSIGIVTPGVTHARQQTSGAPLSPMAEERSLPQSDKALQGHQSKSSWDRATDYFSSRTVLPTIGQATLSNTNALATPNNSTDDGAPLSPAEPEKETHVKDQSTSFSKRLRIPFTARKSGRSHLETKQSVGTDEKTGDPGAGPTKITEGDFEDTFSGVIQRMQSRYQELAKEPHLLTASLITPSLPVESPIVDPPVATRIVIQEDRPDAGGVVDLYEGTVGTVAAQADLIEKVGPFWLGEVLLMNRIPAKDVTKVLFVLEPYDDRMPSLTTVAGETDRLNANRMLRARKILAYILERIGVEPGEDASAPIRPEECLELYCQNQLIPPLMTLATVRAKIWRNPNDVVLQYKSTGRRKFVVARKEQTEDDK